MDSRGNPTVEVEVYVEGDTGAYMGRAAVPSGASTGIFEACELRDGDKSRYNGKGVLKAVDELSTARSPRSLHRHERSRPAARSTRLLIEARRHAEQDHVSAQTPSSACPSQCAKAAAEALATCQSLYNYIGGCNAKTLPVPMMNILNGGAHATGNNVEIQEFMIMPVSAPSAFREALRCCAEVFHTLKKVLKETGTPAAGVGDEGGYAPNLDERRGRAEGASSRPSKLAGYKPGDDFMIAIDSCLLRVVQRRGAAAII